MNENFYILIIISIVGIAIIIAGFILLQVRNQDKLLQQQKQRAAEEINHHRALLQAVITSQETERQRIGNDLHDEVGSVLSSLRMLIEKRILHTPSAIEDQFTSQSKGMIDNVIGTVRQIAHNLSPRISGKYAFYDSLLELSDMVKSAGAIQLKLDCTELSMPEKIVPNTAMALYRVIAELINNTIKHAQATTIVISIHTEKDVLHIHYADDGIGLAYHTNAAAKGMGWHNIESRLNMVQATWAIQSENTKGCNIEIAVPLEQP